MRFVVNSNINPSGTVAELVFADRFYPSTKTCSSCGHVQQMPLKERVFDCEACDYIADRDLNASLNARTFSRGLLRDRLC
ncbi:zinc ribbon domain-containing protein [Moorena producens JHB]|uniref:Transposase n=1 Tax=Moorena producens (strain JHB) TaxID=1454205 RepID=A0A1W6QDZ6_MOOP1|nr:zinc ribbon domain-containing protein [Moorena producens]ARO38320.1 transposase [Moorena producens JHB]WAN70174.1 zinc ribbon domain-containing protein [Moorena producens JHB]